MAVASGCGGSGRFDEFGGYDEHDKSIVMSRMEAVLHDIRNLEYAKVVFNPEYPPLDGVFIHASDDERLTKEKFITPTVPLGDQDLYNIFYSFFFLSRQKEEGNSYWMVESKGKKEDYTWHLMDVHYFKLSSNAKIMYLTFENIVDFMDKYGIFYEPFVVRSKDMIKETIDEMQAYISHILEKQEKGEKPFKKIVRKYVHRLNILPGTWRFEKHDGDAYDSMKNFYGYYEIDYDKLRVDGYDGIYFPQILFDNRWRFTGELLYIRATLDSIIADTLMVWNWCFDE